MFTSVWSTVGLRIRRETGLGAGRPPIFSTTCGSTITPPLAMPEYMAAICSGVTEMPWPIGMLPIEEEYHLSGGMTAGAASAGRPMCVGRPKPPRRDPAESGWFWAQSAVRAPPPLGGCRRDLAGADGLVG